MCAPCGTHCGRRTWRAARDLAAALKTLWQRLQCDNRALELLWRLPLNGVVGAGWHDLVHTGACPCGWGLPADGPPQSDIWRWHAFWE
eukprot:351002-Chlamydomonas_euryale.AAC.26